MAESSVCDVADLLIAPFGPSPQDAERAAKDLERLSERRLIGPYRGI
jgi:hypothetical protein